MIRLFSLLALIFLLVGESYAAPNKVKSKMGDLDLTRYKDGGEVMCTVGSREVMNIVKMGESSVLVKASCGYGWVPKSRIEYINSEHIAKSVDLTSLGVHGEFCVLDGHYEHDEFLELDPPDRIRRYLGFLGSVKSGYFIDSSYYDRMDDRSIIDSIVKSIRSIYVYYATHPEEPIDSLYLQEKRIQFSGILGLRYLRKEWDSLPEWFTMPSNGDELFDTLFTADSVAIIQSIEQQEPVRRLKLLYILKTRDGARCSRNKEKDCDVFYREMHAIDDSLKYYEGAFYKENLGVSRKSSSFYGGFGVTHIEPVNTSDYHFVFDLGVELLAGIPTRIGDFVYYGGFSFAYANSTIDVKGFRDSGWFILMDTGLMYRPAVVLPFVDGWRWNIQPEVGAGMVGEPYDFETNVFYYSLGLRYERSLQSAEKIYHRERGYIAGWSIGAAVRMSYGDMVGVKVDLRWAI